MTTTLLNTKFRKSVKPPLRGKLLKPGKNNKKLGGKVSVRAFQGYTIYSLTLEERASCPKTCDQWTNCYGNNMPFAHRFNHTHVDFIPLLGANVEEVMENHPDGVLLRLHVLGDFYSVSYVQFWHSMLRKHPKLAIFGYTHRPMEGAIGKHIQDLRADFGARFAIRWSDPAQATPFSTFVAPSFDTAGASENSVVCPEQRGLTESCSACGLCWSMPEKPVIFVEH